MGKTNKDNQYYKNLPDVRMAIEDDDDDDKTFSSSSKKSDTKSKTPVLDTYSRDLTKMAEEGRLDPIVGREKEIERVSQILSRRKKNNPILIGEPGVGKSSIAEGLALRIVQRKVSRLLFNKRVVMLDLASMVAGTKYRGQFEERIKALMAEMEKNPDVILFIDEIHTMIGAGGASGSMDASNMFKPALARGEIQIIGATTLDEYRKHIEKDGALERRFQKVQVEPATPEETMIIIGNIKDKYESHHNVTYTPEAIKACVDLTSRYMTDRFLPDKAIDAMDEAGSRVHISNIVVPKEITDIENKILEIKDQKHDVIRSQKYEEAAKLRDTERKLNDALEKARKNWEEESSKNRQIVTEDNVAEVVSMITGIPLQKVSEKENNRLAKMGQEIAGKVVGQDEAVKKVVRAIQRGRVGMKDANRPVFSGMLIGNSGVGKTELAKQIAKYLFDSEDSLIRLDMSEYMDKISISKIQGSAPGYVGYEDSNVLDRIRRKPYSVILFDEIEKANPEVFNLFLQMLDDGHMTDSHGRKVSFKNCIILMTSNVGTRQVKDFGTGVGFSTKTRESQNEEHIKAILDKELKNKFAPEFINRLDDIIYFRDLGKNEILKIVDLELNKTIKRASDIGFPIEITDELKDHLVEVGYDPKFGARPLKRAIQRWVDDIITDYIIENNPEEGTKFLCDYNKEDEQSFIKPIHTPSEIKELQEHLLPEVKNDDVKVEKPKRTRKKKDE
jgi:ATP-dependent Clp protease ATP-binding subunit ClpC